MEMKLHHRATREVCAAKVLCEMDSILEVELLSQLDHPNVVAVIGYYLPEDETRTPFTILTEWMTRALIGDPGSSCLSPTQKVKIIV
jgi:hypothetical protein